ncbi:MAG: hypothetical protein OXI93_09120 [Bryobacterales bacterium]|nr:hypothetical protein [Bryobacterales bacterium]
MPIIREIGAAFRNLDPEEVRRMSERPISMGVLAADDDLYSLILSFLIPPETSEAKARQAFDCILRVAEDQDFGRCDLGLAQSGIPHPEHFYAFESRMPSATVKLILDDHEDLWVPLAKRFLPFRESAVQRIIWKISKENAYFTVATALPNVVPSIFTLPWAVGEFASDTAFLTMNQVRMAFLIAAASDSDVGYQRQKAQISSIVAAAFGWRAIAREMVSKVPAGGGLVSKGLVSFAGTYVVGVGLDRVLRFGRHLTREEKRQQYAYAFERGRESVHQIVESLTALGRSTANARAVS